MEPIVAFPGIVMSVAGLILAVSHAVGRRRLLGDYLEWKSDEGLAYVLIGLGTALEFLALIVG